MAETSRLTFIETRDGVQAAIAFARITLKIYRKSVLCSRKRGYAKPHHASIPEYRESFIRSYVSFKAYLRKHDSLI